jgi:DUF1365 family protein
VKSGCTPARCAIAGTCRGSTPSATACSCPTCISTNSTRCSPQSPLWSRRRFAPARFRREDFLGDPAKPLDDEVRGRIREETGEEHAGRSTCWPTCATSAADEPDRLLLLLRRSGRDRCEYLVAEVTNTPWNERHSYVLRRSRGSASCAAVRQAFHVSPFNPMEMRYDWRSNLPGERLAIHLENHSERGREFDATLALERRSRSAPRHAPRALAISADDRQSGAAASTGKH